MHVEITKATKSFAARGRVVEALREVSLGVARGEFVALVGPSGCGKSTLLNMVAGLATPTRGTILHDGRQVEGVNRSVGYMTQSDALLPWRTAEANVMLPLLLRGTGRAAARARARDQLARVGLAGFLDAYPRELSGGMRKRAGLARALALDPELLFLDEPTAGLDPIGAAAFDDLILELSRSLGLTVFMITHDLDTLYAITTRVAVLADKHVVAAAPVRDLESSTHPWIREYFLGPRGRAAALKSRSQA